MSRLNVIKIKLFFVTILATIVLFSMTMAVSAAKYTYDNLDRLIKAEYDSGMIISYTYDAAGNILSVHSNKNDDSQYESKEDKVTDNRYKDWNIKFNFAVDPMSVTNQTVFVKDENGNILKNKIEVSENDKRIIIVQPPIEGYEKSKSYTLFIENFIYSTDRKVLKKGVKMNFEIK